MRPRRARRIASLCGGAGLCGFFTNSILKKMDINDWINRVIKGPTGFEIWEDRECVIFHNSREEGIAAFVIRCLANPLCDGSKEVLEAILEQRSTNEPTGISEKEYKGLLNALYPKDNSRRFSS